MKLYADEAGRESVEALDAPLVVSSLARVEVPAALWRKQRTGGFSDVDAGILVGAFEADWFGSPGQEPRFLVVGAVPQVIEEAARLVAVHGLRAYDGVQLASALAARQADPACDTLAAFDGDLRRSAVTEGLHLVPGQPLVRADD